jgi:curved DNA-binding protein
MVHLAKHPDFRVEESNLLHELDVAPWEAVLGTNISVPTLDGPVNIKIPLGTQNGQRLRLRGHGLPMTVGSRGDLVIEVRLQLPEKISERERSLWEQLARESRFNARE